MRRLNGSLLVARYSIQTHIHIGVARGGPEGPRPPKGVKKLHNRFSSAKGTNIYVKVLCLVIVNGNVTKYMPQKCQI